MYEEIWEMCRQVSEHPEFREFSEMQIRSYMHISDTDPEEHITARLKTAAQKASKSCQVVHVYSKERFAIFHKVLEDNKPEKQTFE